MYKDMIIPDFTHQVYKTGLKTFVFLLIISFKKNSEPTPQTHFFQTE